MRMMTVTNNNEYFPGFTWGQNEEGSVIQFQSAIRKVYRKKWYDVLVRTAYEIKEDTDIGVLVQRHLHQVYATTVGLELTKDIIDEHGIIKSEFQGTEVERLSLAIEPNPKTTEDEQTES